MVRAVYVSFLMLLIKSIACSQAKDSVNIFDMSLEELGKIEVYSTSRATKQQVSDAPANVIVITEEQILERGYSSLIELFDDLPDFKVDRGVDPRWQNDITVRGIRYLDKLIILLDGVRISSPTNDIVSFFDNYPLYMAKQVEVVYGPSSALYGADAFAGVVNIVSKSLEKEGLNISSQLKAGSFNVYSGNLYGIKRFKSDLEVSFGGSFYSDEQPDLAEYYPEEYIGRDQILASGIFPTSIQGLDTITPNTPVEAEAEYPLEAFTYFGKARYKNLNLTLFGNHAQSPSSTANTPNNTVYNDEQFFGHNVNMVSLQHTKSWSNYFSKSQLTYSTYRLDEQSNFRNAFTLMEPAYLYAESWKIKAEQIFKINFPSSLDLTSGITFESFFSRPRSNNLEAPVDNNFSNAIINLSRAPLNPDGINAELITSRYKNIGAFLQLAFTKEKYDATIGFRIDSDDRFDPTFNPRLGFIYKPNKKLNLKALIGSAYLAPSPQNISDRYGIFFSEDDGLTYQSAFFNLPNPNLEPQTIVTSEIGIKYLLNRNLEIQATSYFSDVRNLISPVNNATNPELIESLYPNNIYEIDGFSIPIDTIQVNANFGESTIFGGNIGLSYRWNKSKNTSGSIQANISYIDGEIDVDEEGPLETRNLPGVAPFTFRILTSIRHKNLSVFMSFAHFTSQRTFGINSVKSYDNAEYKEIDGYESLNINLNYRITKHITINIEGSNLLDQRYRNVNIGAGEGGGSSQVEFSEGAPQNPIRIQGGIIFRY